MPCVKVQCLILSEETVGDFRMSKESIVSVCVVLRTDGYRRIRP